MPEENSPLPAELVAEIPVLIPYLLQAGWEIFEFRYEPETFGNWYVDFFRSSRNIRLVKDRSQYFVNAPKADLEAAGMSHVFTNATEFQQSVIEGIKHLE
jgi:hypothetical protein